MKKRARVDFKSSCSAYPPTYYSGGHKNIRTAYSLKLKALPLYFKKWKLLSLTNKKLQSLPFCYLLYFYSYLRYTSIQDKHRKGYSTKTGLSPYLSRLTLSYTEVIFSSISFRFCVYRYRPIISQLPILYSIDEGEYLSSSFQHLRLTSSRWT